MTDTHFDIAQAADARAITDLRQQIWATTYRGIYRDEMIDHYDYAAHEQKDLQKIVDNDYDVFIVRQTTDFDKAIGYFILQHTPKAYIQSLYLIADCQHKGIGKRIFVFIRDYFRAHGCSVFECNCNLHNTSAQRFYLAMGGAETSRTTDHPDRRDDQITYIFQV